MRNIFKPMSVTLFILCSFGVASGVVSPRIVNLFIQYIPSDNVRFTLSCLLTGIMTGIFSFIVIRILLYKTRKFYKKILLDKGLSHVSYKASKSKDAILNTKEEFKGLMEKFCTFKAQEADVLKKLSIIDSTTGLYNHRYLFNFFQEQISIGYKSVFVLFCDIDHFRKLNDLYGHDFGDLVLYRAAKIIKTFLEREMAFLKQEDQILKTKAEIFRYGGEEFIALLLCNNIEEAYTTAERLRKEVMESPELNEICSNFRISISIGLSAYPTDGRNIETVIDKSKKAMFYSKRLGRNRCYVYTDKLEGIVVEDMISYDEIEILMKFLDVLTERIISKNNYTMNNSEEVMKYSLLLADRLNLADEDKRILKIGALLYDIGKIAVPEEIINKPGTLSKEEWEIIKNHTLIGSSIIKKIKSLAGAEDCILHHHERWDGRGYPYGLSGRNIPLLARIINICDSYYAMKADFPYRGSLSKEEAIEELKKNKGLQFDPELVDIFIDIIGHF